jgi:glycosyltransferase involved in cell wall biosynthesis
MKKATIIMPHFSESEQVVRHQLAAWNNQLFVKLKDDYEFIIVSDGPDSRQISSDFLKTFSNIELKHIIAPENRGPGMCRQLGIDNAHGKYITCCDIDDTLASTLVLFGFEKEAFPKDPDMLMFQWASCFIHPQTNETLIAPCPQGLVWMFGKFIKRDFIKHHKVRFDEQILSNEDGSFLQRLNCYNPKIIQTDHLMYLWRTAENSITRQNHAEYSFTCRPEFIIVKDSVLDVMNTVQPQAACQYLAQALVHTYLILFEDNADHPQEFKEYWNNETKRILAYLYQKWKWVLEDNIGKDFKLKEDFWKPLISETLKAVQNVVITKSIQNLFDELESYQFETLEQRPEYAQPNFHVIKNDNVD